jgi:hypothetical protein
LEVLEERVQGVHKQLIGLSFVAHQGIQFSLPNSSTIVPCISASFIGARGTPRTKHPKNCPTSG